MPASPIGCDVAHMSIHNLTVEFAIFGANARSLKNTVLAQATGGRIMAGARDVITVRAIDQMNMEINDGDRLGISGHNGSGKTTLLRVLAGIYKPVSGRVRIEGKVGTLLDPSAGMDPEVTGIENIYLRGHMFGMTNREIAAQIDDIAGFSDLGDFIELPMKTYSAGMQARLAFAISTSMKNDILLVDEGIGAGDEAFQEKAQKRVERLFARTSIVLLASHSEELLKRFCNRRMKLEHGRIVEHERIA
jgi:lipopolysaccharide transport system ATP-binding protein